MELTKKQIEEINKKCPFDQGIFTEPWGIPTHIKEPVIYTVYITGGVDGGTCWEDSDPQRFAEEPPKDRYKVIELVLSILMPKITFIEYKQVEALMHTNDETECQYYGNEDDKRVEYIILSELLVLLTKLSGDES